MDIAQLAVEIVLFGWVLYVMGGILAAVKTGFSEVIKALESIDERLAK